MEGKKNQRRKRPLEENPKALRTHVLRLLGPKTILCRAVEQF